MSSSSTDRTDNNLFSLLYIPFKEIESATNSFAEKNLLTNGNSFEVYKGQLLQSPDLIDIVARKCKKRNRVTNELEISKKLKHKNIVSTFKLAFGNNEDIIINKYEANESLDIHLGGSTLTWVQRLHICVGVAKALCYLHYDVDRNHNIIHGNIKSSKILLDNNWEPKLHGFAFAVKAKKNQLHRTNKYNGSLKYMDPTYETTQGLTHKSDVFSFGVVLFEVLFGVEASIENNDKWYFARLARSCYEERKLEDLIHPRIRKQMNLQSSAIYIETAYCCLKEQRSHRPDMGQVLSRLQKALEIQHKHERSTAVVEDRSTKHLKGRNNLNPFRFALSDIQLATNYFSETYLIGSGAYGKVYKAELEHFDGINSLEVQGKNQGVLPKKHSIVAIKRISSRADAQGEQGYFREIEMLSKCNHQNIVSLLGFCDEKSEFILVYDYVSNGSIENHLENTDNMKSFTWAQRIKICLDIAYGLDYLHKQCIIHRDVKSANVLLDDNWVAKIGDFGLSVLHHLSPQHSTLFTCNIAGTKMYLDPEYESTGKLKAKSDIYSFGVVLFEIMCGKLAYDKSYNEAGLPSIARQCFNDGTLNKLVDPKIKEVGMLIEEGNSFDTFSKIAIQCLAKTQSDRPTMESVIKELKKSLQFEEERIQRSNTDHVVNKVEKLQLTRGIGEERIQRSNTDHVVNKVEKLQLTRGIGGSRLPFVTKAAQNPAFIEHLAHIVKSLDVLVDNEERRLPRSHVSQEDGLVNDYSPYMPDFGNVFHHDFSNKLRLELSPAVSDVNFVSNDSTQSSNEDDGSPQGILTDDFTRTNEMTTPGGGPQELIDTCASFGFNMKTGSCVDANEEPEGYLSCQLNLTLASCVSQIDSSQDTVTIPESFEGIRKTSGQDVISSSHDGRADNATPVNVQARVNDVFWEQFLTERPGSSDIEETLTGSSLRSTPSFDQEDSRSGYGSYGNSRNLRNLTL